MGSSLRFASAIRCEGVPDHGERILPGSYFLRFNNSESLITYIRNLGSRAGIGDNHLYTVFDATFLCDIQQAQGYRAGPNPNGPNRQVMRYEVEGGIWYWGPPPSQDHLAR